MKTLCIASLIAGTTALPAAAQSAGEWTVGIGAGSVQPKDDNGTVAGSLDVEVDGNTRPTLTVEYFLRDNVGIELLAATPFQHDVNIKGVGKVGSVKHLPPVLSVNYHWDTGSAFRPYAGIGLNYTSFWGEDTQGALDGADLDLKHSFGLALQAGADWWLNDKSAIRGTLRWIDIDSDVYLNGSKIGEVEIDPIAVQAAYVMKF
ncbi:OmpW/AlkL family protein [Paracoccus sphaerophysae]|uniref:Membrane protein n=1 Tax=Paracoccus sphaerophysae TaxID=690417 RepID=A0A099EU44_9RHOB|nr:OmpW family outer membrane protein [Paracoccus sphaerophysae]KGJ01920.1 membrane protein [Paracoccus sphaerophysae]